MRFEHKVVIVVGAGNDVGRCCARAFAAEGAAIVAIDDNAAVCDELCAQIRGGGGEAVGYAAASGDAEALESIADLCRQRFLAAHVLVTSPMAIETTSIELSTPASWRRITAANLLGPVFAAKAFLPLLREAHGAAIVHMGSIDGLLGNPQVPSYSATKGAVVPLTHVMASEFAPYGIRVNCVARAMMADASDQSNPKFDTLNERTPLARPALPSEVAAAALFLASDEASYITGVVLPVDGGRTGLTPGTFTSRLPPSRRA